MFVEFNPNPSGSNVGDCVIRALSLATGSDWDSTYLELANLGFEMRDMPSANHVWGEFLRRHGFKRYAIPDTCPSCYTVKDFCADHPQGLYVLGTGSHVVTALNGSYYDSWDSGNEPLAFVWRREI